MALSNDTQTPEVVSPEQTTESYGSTGGDQRNSQDRDPPWNQDPRFREDLAALKEYKANKAEYQKAKEERDAFLAGSHPTQKQWAQSLVGEVNQQWEAALKKNGLYEVFQNMYEKGSNEVIQPEPEQPKYMTEAQFEERLALKERETTLERDFEKCIGASPFGVKPGFNNMCRTMVPTLIKQDLESGKPAKKMEEYVGQVESMLEDTYDVMQSKRQAARKAPPSLKGPGNPGGMSRAEALALQRKIILENMMASVEK